MHSTDAPETGNSSERMSLGRRLGSHSPGYSHGAGSEAVVS